MVHESSSPRSSGMYSEGVGVAEDLSVAFEWFLKAANLGLAKAQCNVGVLYQYDQGVSIDYQAAMEWYLKAAEQGY